MANKTKKKRIFYYDELRAIAICAVILCHVANLFPYLTDNIQAAVPFFCSDLGGIGVPLFLMLSGALLLNREYELGSFFKRRFSRILIPFVFWVILTCIIRLTVFGKSPDAVISWALGNGLTWYIWELLGLYLFLPVVNEFILKFKMQGVKYLLILWIANLVLVNFNITVLPHFKLQYFGGYMGYMILGYYLANAEIKVNDVVMILLGIVMFLACYIINCSTSFQIGETIDYLQFLTILQSVGVFIAVKRISLRSERNPNALTSRVHNFIEKGKLGKMIVSISICSYGMYFVHYIVCKSWTLVIKMSTVKLIPPLLIATIIISWLVILVLSKIPIVDNISGVK